MALEVVRIDDRLVHGQVVVGWCPEVQPDRLIICDDLVAGCEWEREIYKEAAMDYSISVCSVSGAAHVIKQYEQEKLFLIVASPVVIVQLIKRGIPITSVVVGGMHYDDGKRKIANFIYVNDADLEAFSFLDGQNVHIEGRDMPGCKPIDIIEQLRIA